MTTIQAVSNLGEHRLNSGTHDCFAEKEETGWRNHTHFSLIQPGSDKVDQNWSWSHGSNLNEKEARKQGHSWASRERQVPQATPSSVFCLKSPLHAATRLLSKMQSDWISLFLITKNKI